ncbi:toll-like receptor 6 [Crassostrea angulata]|uniref:toll-like receptor 6 n=1 Tax=Magallana angulata TaxID=2784310 RepID=UPI0022B1A352|nr:toll-like receptor 6 [Crassostrea angulata]
MIIIQEDWITVNVITSRTHFSYYFPQSSIYLHVNSSEDLKLTVGNQASLDSSVGVWNIIFVFFGCLLIIIFILFVVFRKRIEYRVYRVKQTIRRGRRLPGDCETGRPFFQENKKYDVYLSYSEEDYPWVREHLLSHIDKWETEENSVTAFGTYKIYCSDRDSHHGKSELENMCENIELSRVAVVVLSSSYTQKHLHTVELEHLLYSKDVSVIKDIVIIMIEDLKFKQIPAILHHQIKQDKFLRWEADETKEKKFYRDLMRFLK